MMLRIWIQILLVSDPVKTVAFFFFFSSFILSRIYSSNEKNIFLQDKTEVKFQFLEEAIIHLDKSDNVTKVGLEVISV